MKPSVLLVVLMGPAALCLALGHVDAALVAMFLGLAVVGVGR